MTMVAALSDGDRSDVFAAAAAVDIADAPVKADAFRALRDPGLRAAVAAALDAQGRVLVERDDGWLSGYRDDVAARLVREGLTVLKTTDRAVLTLVLLLTVAVPQARGGLDGQDWTACVPTTIEELQKSKLSRKAITESLRRLRILGIVNHSGRGGIGPGPQFLRLSEQSSGQLWEELMLLCRPSGLLADVIRRRRGAAAAQARNVHA
jgi:hypothetical protein